MRRELSTYRSRSPWDLFREMDEIFNQFNGSPASQQSNDYSTAFAPAADIQENDSGYLMAFDLPGIREKDVKIEVKDGVLSIHGERKRESSSNEKGWTRTERTFGSFHRSFSLPTDVNPKEIEAQVENGELHLFLPKSALAQPVSIPVKTQAKETGEVKGLMERFFSAKDKSEKKVEDKH